MPMPYDISRRTALAMGAMAWASAAAAQGKTVTFDVPLSGQEQVPPINTPGKGTAAISYDPSTRGVSWNISYQGLDSDVTMAHFHGPAPEGKNGPVQVWLTKKGGTLPPAGDIKGSATLTPAQAKMFTAGDMYINIHTKDHPAGSIRGQVVPPKSA
jgi:CHRD domain